jgi:iron complex transport system substrate-binding protein
MFPNKRSILWLAFVLAVGTALAACQPVVNPAPDNAVVVVENDAANTAENQDAPEEEAPATIDVVDGLGRTVTLAAPAQSVISLAPSNTEILHAIGALDQIVARDDFANFPESVLELPSVGGSFGELNTELILSLAPDLVLAADITTPEQVSELEGLGLVVFMVPNPLSLDDLYENMRVVAELTGQLDGVEAIILDLQAQVAAVQAALADVEERPLVFYELDATDPNAPWTAGEGTFIDTLITMAGGQNLGGAFSDPWVQVSAEELIAQNPDIILLGDAIWGVTVESVGERAGWEGIAAVANEHIYPFDDDLVSRPGPRMIQGLQQLAELLHPDQFE